MHFLWGHNGDLYLSASPPFPWFTKALLSKQRRGEGDTWKTGEAEMDWRRGGTTEKKRGRHKNKRQGESGHQLLPKVHRAEKKKE